MLLKVNNLETGYAIKQVINGLSLNIEKAEIVAIIGPNGSGKSTLLKTVFGLIPVWKGEIIYNDIVINDLTPTQAVTKGIGFAPQGNRVFSNMDVMDNLKIGAFHLSPKESHERISQVMELFPMLKSRLRQEAGNLSGGEQQMLALARAMIPKPMLLMLDEPSLGLSPSLVDVVFKKVLELNKGGVSILIVEQRVREVLNICDRVYAIKHGTVAFNGQPEELKDDKMKMKQLFL